MRNVLKTATLESKFPLLSVEQGCIISKDADITVAFQVTLPELFTVTSDEYEAIHSVWNKAIKVLPDYSIVHKQDWYIKEKYQPKQQEQDLSFLSSSFERHFNERPYLSHTCYLFLTKTTNERSRQQSTFSSLAKGFLLPKEIKNKESFLRFVEAVNQFEQIINDSDFVCIARLTAEQITGTEKEPGIVEKYFSHSQERTASLQDITLNSGEMKIGDNTLILHTLSDLDDLPAKVSTESRYERLSTDRSSCLLSFASPVGLLLPCNHIYNQFIFIDDHSANLARFEKMARNMHSLSRYSRANQINKQWLDEYLNEAHSKGLVSVRAHFNVLAWSDRPEELRQIKNDAGSQIALMECKPRYNTVDVPTLFWAGIPGNAADFPSEESFYTFTEQGTHVLLVDTGNSYKGLCDLIHYKTRGEDGVYFTYTEDNPIAFNPFYTDDGVFDIEKRESIKTLILTLWKNEEEAPTRSEEVALSNAVNQYIVRLKSEGKMAPSFNTFYEFVRDEYSETLRIKKVREKDFDIANFLNVLEPYYREGEYDYLLNSDKQMDLLNKRFVVFELDNIKDHKILFPIVTIIIMEAFINKMRRLKGIRKMILIEEAWKAIAREGMAEYIKYLFKTVQKFFGEAVVVTQEVDDIIASEIVKESIINNSDCKILLDQRKYMNKFGSIQELLGLTEKEKSQILSINLANHPRRKYKEVWIGLGGVQSAVYATEVSLEEYYTYTTEETEKLELVRLTEQLDGNIELAIKQLAASKRKA